MYAYANPTVYIDLFGYSSENAQRQNSFSDDSATPEPSEIRRNPKLNLKDDTARDAAINEKAATAESIEAEQEKNVTTTESKEGSIAQTQTGKGYLRSAKERDEFFKKGTDEFARNQGINEATIKKGVGAVGIGLGIKGVEKAVEKGTLFGKLKKGYNFVKDKVFGKKKKAGDISQSTKEIDDGVMPGSVGASKVWTKKGRLKAIGLPTKGKIRFVPAKGYNPSNPLPRGPNNGIIDRFGNEWTKGPSRTKGQDFEWDVQLSKTGKQKLGWATRDGSHANISLDGRITHK